MVLNTGHSKKQKPISSLSKGDILTHTPRGRQAMTKHTAGLKEVMATKTIQRGDERAGCGGIFSRVGKAFMVQGHKARPQGHWSAPRQDWGLTLQEESTAGAKGL